MRSRERARNVRPRWSSLAFLALVVLTAATLSQCKMVDERLTGVASPFKDQPTKCMQQCNKDSDRALRRARGMPRVWRSSRSGTRTGSPRSGFSFRPV